MILFLGAGASHPFGVPTTAGFTEQWANTSGRESGSLFDTVSRAFHGRRFNMEIVMTIVHDLAKDTEEDFLRTVSPHTARFLLEQELGLDFYHGRNVEAIDLLKKLQRSIVEKCHAVLSRAEDIIRVYDQLFNALAAPDFMSGIGINRISMSSEVSSPLPVTIFTVNYDNAIDIFSPTKALC